MPPAVTIRPSPAITSVPAPTTIPGVTPSMMSGLPALPIADDPAAANSDVRLHDAPVIQNHRVGDHQVEHAACGGRRRRLAHAVAQHLAAAELRFVAGHCEIALDLDQQFGVGQPDAIAGGRTVEIGVLAARNSQASSVRFTLQTLLPRSAHRHRPLGSGRSAARW